MTTFGIHPQALAIYQAAQESYRQHNHTLDKLDLMRCPCGNFTIIAKLPYERCRVVICEGCGDWHTVLFKWNPPN